MVRLITFIALIFGLNISIIYGFNPKDTIYLEGVEIFPERHEFFSSSSKIQSIDTTILKSNYHSNFASILNSHTPIAVRSYGPGVLSTISLRGGAASHTAFIWNGFNIQNPMNAQNDLALMPASFADEIQIQYGGGSSIWGSGAVGGAIIMNNNPTFEKGLKVGLNSSVSTNEDFQNIIHTKWSNESISSSLRVIQNNSKNKYSFVNNRMSNDTVLKQKNAKYSGWGFLQENYFKPKNNHIINLTAWYQNFNRNIPPTLFQNQNKPQAKQNDRFLRITGGWKTIFDNFTTEVKTGYFEDFIHYNDDNTINSESLSRTQNSNAELRYYFSDRNTISLGFNHQYKNAEVDDYKENPTENKYTFLTSWRWKNNNENIIALLNFRQKFAKEYDVEPTPSIGITYKLTDRFAINANAGNTYKLPTLNDRYWSPGGNPNLEPESGWSQDIEFEFIELFKKNGTNFQVENLSLAIFHRKLNNWISWVPGEGGLWSPKNIKEVRSYGLEANQKLSYSLGKTKVSIIMFYSLTKSINENSKNENDATIGKQLPYIPKHKGGMNVNVSYAQLSISYNHSYNGIRYTVADNTRWLDPYDIADARISYTTKIFDAQTSLFLIAHNIFNQSYEIMQSRPMPLRYFQAGFGIKF